ncbi:MAG: hypothetical protein AAFV29_14370, partial [Myxococcota bacterium]
MNQETMNPAQRALWADLLGAYETTPEYLANMPKWAEFLSHVTAYDGKIECRWKGMSVFLDAEAPYISEPHADFPITETHYGNTYYSAWLPERVSPPQHLAERGHAKDTEYRTHADIAGMHADADEPALKPSEDLDAVCKRSTAFRTFGHMIDAMRGTDGYGQKYIPTLRIDEDAIFSPQHGQDLRALRAAIQEHGFAVHPTDEEYARQNEFIDEPETCVEVAGMLVQAPAST